MKTRSAIAVVLLFMGCNSTPSADVDSGLDAGTIEPTDAGVDAGTDAGVDAGIDAGVDAGIDAGIDAGEIDAGVDAGPLIRTLTAFDSATGTVVPSGYGADTGTCDVMTRDTSSCQAAREALGLSGNWLAFSCNVVEGLATSGQVATTSMSNAVYVSLTSQDLPEHPSNYYPTTGTYDFTAYGYTVTGNFDDLYTAFTPAFPDPGSIADAPVTMYIPLQPAAAASESKIMGGMYGGAEGMAIDGIIILDSAAGATDNIFAEAASFDECGGHPNNQGYHYHSEPYSLTYDDDAFVGVMRDGFFIYGRQDSDGSVPGSFAEEVAGGTGSSNLIYIYGGHTGTAPSADDTNAFHYHLTEWKGCYDETVGMHATIGADNGAAYDPSGTFNSPATSTCNGSWTDGWFLTGHGNGGTYMQVPSGLGGQSPSQTTTATRYFYGSPGPCTGCTGG